VAKTIRPEDRGKYCYPWLLGLAIERIRVGMAVIKGPLRWCDIANLFNYNSVNNYISNDQTVCSHAIQSGFACCNFERMP
jgi:hypothetical protein